MIGVSACSGNIEHSGYFVDTQIDDQSSTATETVEGSEIVMGGPANRDTYTSAEPADKVVFNAITDNPKHGDERNFVLIREAGVGTYVNEIKLEVGKEYEVYTYYHNNAKSRLNTVASGEVGIARGTRLYVDVPTIVKPGERGKISSSIYASNADPQKVWDEAYVTADSAVALQYVKESAIIHNAGTSNGSLLSESMFTSEGTLIGDSALNGIIPGCADFAGYIIYRLEVLSQSAWGPQDRPTFSPNQPALYPVFNSMIVDPNSDENRDNNITNTIGNERNFVKVKEYGSAGIYSDDVNLEVGKEFEVYVYYHNNGSASLNKADSDNDGWPDGIARDVRLKFSMPGKLSKGQTGIMTGTVSSMNTTPKEVWDSAYMHANDTVYLRYVSDSTVIHNGGSANGENLNGTNMFGENGTYLGHSNLLPNDGADEISWGLIPACNEYAGYVTFRFKVDQPKFMLTKEVSRDGAETWVSKLEASGSEVLDFKIRYDNIGTTNQERVSVFDELPDGLEYIKGSTYLTVDGREPKLLSDDLFGTGFYIGGYVPGTGATIRYRIRVSDGYNEAHLLNKASVATENGTMYDSVAIDVN
jgi:uncharacterized repeat protein (TIGR01451 family)